MFYLNYAIRYFKGSTAIEKADEIILRNPEFFCTVDDLVSFSEKINDNQRIVVDLSNIEIPANKLDQIDKQMENYADFFKRRNNFALKGSNNNPDFAFIYPLINQYEIPFFFNETATDEETVKYFQSLGVSDIYIGRRLGFKLPYIKKFCEKHNIKIRVIPNYASNFVNIGIASFFIRPEDLSSYEDCIDICEFYTDDFVHPSSKDVIRQDVFYDIYSKGRWDGYLNHIIYNFKQDIYNPTIVGAFGVGRKHCQQKCLLEEDGCHICNTVLLMGKVWEDNNEQKKSD